MISHRYSVVTSIALIATFTAIIQPSAAQTPATAFVVSQVRVFDGERTQPDTNVVIEGGLIRFVGRTIPKGWKALPTINGTGLTLLPGFIDAHTHTNKILQLQEALRFGVTTVLDMATSDVDQLLRKAAKPPDVADFRSAGIAATAPGGHGTEYGGDIPTVPGPAAAEPFVAARQSQGADYVKIILNGVRAARDGTPTMDAATARALVQASHARGLLVVAHVENLNDVRIAVASGVDGLAHVWRQGGDAPDIAKLVVENRVFVIPTLATPHGFIPGNCAALAADPRLKPFLSPATVRRLTGETPSPIPGPVLANIDQHLAAVKSLVAAGATLLAGTDPPVGCAVHGVSLHRELELLVKAGLSPSQALAAATKNTADAFRLRDRGRIAVGARADLLLVRGDPTSDITATRDIVRVWRAGLDFDRALALH